MKTKTEFRTRQKVEFVKGTFKGKTGVVQFVGDRVLVKINGTGPDANGRRTKLGSTFAERDEIKAVEQ